MSEVTQSTEPNLESAAASPKPLSPWRCLIGAIVAGVIAIALYKMTAAIAHSFATKPIQSSSYIVHRISAAVRTLVVGMSTLGTGVFGFAALGLFGLAIQILIQQIKGQSTPPTPDS